MNPSHHNLEQAVVAKSSCAGFPWFALQVRAQREKAVAAHLLGRGFELFLPLYNARKRWSDRIKEFEAPLFPGYLFCRFNSQDRLPILTTPWVIQIVGFNGGPIPVDEQEIKDIRTLIASGLPNQPWSFLTIGEKVRIESGPLAGLEGILEHFKGKHQLIVSVSLLKRSVAVEMDSGLVRSLRTPRVSSSENAAAKPYQLELANS